VTDSSPISYELFDFLTDLQISNRREWFAEHKQRYIDEVLNPAVELCSRLESPLKKIAPHLSVIPKPHRGSVMRVYRDTRFSRDKTPYKTNVGISFRHKVESDIHAPGIYIHLEPRNCFIGCGCWKPDRPSLSLIRASILERTSAWKKVLSHIQHKTDFTIAGDKLKRGPRDLPSEHPYLEDLKRTDFILIEMIPEETLTGRDAIPHLVSRIKAARPWMQFLCRSLNIDY